MDVIYSLDEKHIVQLQPDFSVTVLQQARCQVLPFPFQLKGAASLLFTHTRQTKANWLPSANT